MNVFLIKKVKCSFIYIKKEKYGIGDVRVDLLFLNCINEIMRISTLKKKYKFSKLFLETGVMRNFFVMIAAKIHVTERVT